MDLNKHDLKTCEQLGLVSRRSVFKGVDLNPAEFTDETAQVQVLARKRSARLWCCT